MADSTAIALVSVSVAGLATVGAPFITGWMEDRRELRRAERERRAADLAELRDLLDKEAVSFERIRLLILQLRRLFRADEPGGHRAAKEVQEQLHDELRELMRLYARLTIRVKESEPVVTTAKSAQEKLRKVTPIFDAWLAQSFDSWTPEERRSRFDWKKLDGAQDRYLADRDAFLREAQRRVGSKLTAGESD